MLVCAGVQEFSDNGARTDNGFVDSQSSIRSHSTTRLINADV